MSDNRNRVCPVERAGNLDTWWRRWLHNPKKIVGPYIEEGMTIMDIGCGPGFFSTEMAKMAGKTGRVIAVDLQEGMLTKVREKIRGTQIEDRIILHKCAENSIGVSEQVDFVLLFYMVHEVPDSAALFGEIASILKPSGRILVVEPPFHVSKAAFEEMLAIAGSAGLRPVERPRVFFGRTAVLKHS